MATTQDEKQELDTESVNKRLGVDSQFNEQKHGYVLTFPWNYPEIISDYEQDYKPLDGNNFWCRFFDGCNATEDFNQLFREFHQWCAIPDFQGLDLACERKLSNYVKESISRISFHGLDIEMANLTVKQPNISILKAEVYQNLSVKREENLSISDYQVTESQMHGAKHSVYIKKKNDDRHFLDFLDYGIKPYVVAVTALIESPMKLYVQNQNYSSVLFGSDDKEMVKNVVRFETQVRWLDFTKLLPVENKPRHKWVITDFNNVLDENPIVI